MITTLRISGMTCNHCVQHVTRALQQVRGVAGVNVDLGAGEATIDHGDGTPAAELVGAVVSAGYEASGD